jgi:L,D-transpeptidase ErfK/SrfK
LLRAGRRANVRSDAEIFARVHAGQEACGRISHASAGIVIAIPRDAMRSIGALVMALAIAASAMGQLPPPGSRMTGGVTLYEVVSGDTLQSISSRVGVDPATLAADNLLRLQTRLVAGQTLRVDNRHIVPQSAVTGITINVPQRLLFYISEGATVGLPVSVGTAGWKTPRQAFHIVSKETDPTWDVPESIREEARREGRTLPKSVPPGPANPLGQYWLGLSIPGVGIHGTNVPTSIYRVTTHGCIRLGAEDIAWLHDQVAVGTTGRVVYEPILLAATADDVLLEVHRDVYRELRQAPLDLVRALADNAGVTSEIDWTLVETVIAAQHGAARSVRRTR